MKYFLKIYRQKDRTSEGYFKEYEYETEDDSLTAAMLLMYLNTEHPDDPIRWEHSCHQKKCGACAMLVNGRPMLACDAVVKEAAKKGTLTLAPLGKFPVVADLIVDRSVMMENLKQMKTWAEKGANADEKNVNAAYEASKCLQCGCCLEVCPNFYAEGSFLGTAAFVPSSRLITELSKEESAVLRKNYRKHVFAGCGKSLACRDICPAGIDIDMLLSRSNAASVWRR